MGKDGRNLWSGPALPRASDLPPELAFIPPHVVPAAALHRAARRARWLGVSAARVVMTDGHLSSERYYRLLAAHLGLPFAERPVRPAADASIDEVFTRGVLPLAPNRFGWRALGAPTGALLQTLLNGRAAEAAGQGLAITSPDRLEALIRQDRRASVAREASDGLADWNRTLSAKGGPSARQFAFGTAAVVLACAAAWLWPAASLDLMALVFSLAFLLAVAVRLAATAASPPPRAARVRRVSDADLPIYSVVVPLYREAREVRRLTAALDRLDYPRAKLDILLMIEANDRATLGALDQLGLPACYRTIMAPAGRPQTKPRALNVALQFARGDVLVVYDAEDEPEPDQLRAAVAAFAAEPDIACLQARLAIDNWKDSWLTRMFAIEYAALFEVVNPGLAELGWPVPLGGTSNHFRTAVLRRVAGWDAWNVTEDIDLGLRLARFGHRVAALASTTYEEAPRTLKAWLAQRRRWQKGWMVTLATHTRQPLRTWAELGVSGGLVASGLLFGTIASCLLGPFCAVLAVLRLVSGELLHPRTHADAAWSTLSCFLLAIGLASALWPALAGLRQRRLLRLAWWLPTWPAYLALLSLAAWQALFEVAGRPYAWAKTEHGRAKRRLGAAARRV